jgi:hypothetical protein
MALGEEAGDMVENEGLGALREGIGKDEDGHPVLWV